MIAKDREQMDMWSFQQFYLSSANFSWRRSHSPRNGIEINSYYEVGIKINTDDFPWRRSRVRSRYRTLSETA